jgi:hypothetical protein
MPKYLINTEQNNIKDNAISLKHLYNWANFIEYYLLLNYEVNLWNQLRD